MSKPRFKEPKTVTKKERKEKHPKIESEDIKGLTALISRVRKAENATKGYADRHDQLLEDMKADPEFDPLSCLPGLMWVQLEMEDSLKAVGYFPYRLVEEYLKDAYLCGHGDALSGIGAENGMHGYMEDQELILSKLSLSIGDIMWVMKTKEGVREIESAVGGKSGIFMKITPLSQKVSWVDKSGKEIPMNKVIKELSSFSGENHGQKV